MSYPIDVAIPSGAVSLGPDVVCDGFISKARARVQTHVHTDHMDGFESSKGHQIVVASEPTVSLLIAEFNADLPYRSNIKALQPGDQYRAGESLISLLPNGHMLGSVQVQVVLRSGLSLGYSGDFQWPLSNTIQVEALVVDSTYGAPHNRREFSQGECEERFLALLYRLLRVGPVIVKAHRGTVQRALQLIFDEVECPVITSERLEREVAVYRDYGYTIGDLCVESSQQARQLMKADRYIAVYSTGDHVPSDIGNRSKLVLSAYFTQPNDPIVKYSDRAFGVAMSNHADFEGTLEYVRATGAEYVMTDNSRGGKGWDLAQEITLRLGIEARASSGSRNYEWGS